MDDDDVSVRLVNYLSANTAASMSDRKNSLGVETMTDRRPSADPAPVFTTDTKTSNDAATTSNHQGPTSSEVKAVSRLPNLFERSAHSWWNPRFDSDVLEEQHFKSSLPQNRRHIRYVLAYVLWYVLLSFLLWGVYYGLMDWTYWGVHLALVVVVLGVFALSFTPFYRSHTHVVSFIIAHVLAFFEIFVCIFNPLLTPVGTFTGSVEFLLIVYKFLPLPLYVCVSIGLTFSVIIETLSSLYTDMDSPTHVTCRALLHLCIHIIGIHVYIMAQVRRRSTFMKVGQSILARRDLQVEKQLKHNMIHSLMPPKVAEEIMKSRENDREGEGDDQRHRSSQGGGPDRGKMNFRSFHMSQMDNVSILFADIVGFTRMSSNKSAEHLVSLLNDLFGRFDDICKKCNCEKISTLGDCYYCVSGCPEPRADHAKCCVEMGLAMCIAIMQFDDDHCEEVNMRVGVHTGTVLCGLVGTRRFKFDVWSHDVTLANMMESEGRPGCVHVSDCTHQFISEDYEFESGEDVPDIRRHKVLIEAYNSETQQYIVRHIEKKNNLKTWFIVGRKNGEPISWTVPNDVTVAGKQPLPRQNDVTVAMELNDATTHNKQSTNGVKETPPPSSVTVVVQAPTENQSTATHDEGTKGEEGTTAASGVAPGVTHLLQQKQADEQTDKELVKCISECSDVEDYLYHPPINQCTLHFLDGYLEEDYRSHCWGDPTKTNGAGLTFSQPDITSLLDIVVSFIFFLFISISGFIAFSSSISSRLSSPAAPSTVFVVGLLLELLVLVIMLLHVFLTISVSTAAERAGQFMSSWYPRHLLGGLIATLPTLVVFSFFCCDAFKDFPLQQSEFFFSLLIIASLLHFCNFTMLCSLLKSTLATVASLILVILITVGVCPTPDALHPPYCTNSTLNSTTSSSSHFLCHNVTNSSSSTVTPMEGDPPPGVMVFSGGHSMQLELIFDVVLLLLLLCFLNREIEIGYRVCYHGDVQAVKDRQKIETEKEQADWLLHNIVPEHVADLLKHHDQYCKNHKDVGVIFAKISNFDDFYDESFEGGKEYLRVLNELLGDFEDLFDEPKYKDVEKIKTIGSCLMAASGLNPQTRNQNKDPNAHLYALMDFSIGILRKLEEFNKDIFNFDFEMAIGLNFGEVTAGVIGTTKLLYDIWGDTVNIASRMYSTGVHERIQVTEDTAKKLADKFDFEYRGQTYVKGKGDMNTYLLVGKKPGATWD